MGAGEGGGKCVAQTLYISSLKSCTSIPEDGDFGAVTLESEALGELQRQDLRG